MAIPIREDIDVFGTLDERQACRHFLGKTVDEAFNLFAENALLYQEDLMVMGSVAFQYYVPAFIRYIDRAIGDSDAINCFLGVLEHRLNSDASSVLGMAVPLGDACRTILDRYEDYDVTENVYGDLRPRYRAVLIRLGVPAA